MQVQKISSPAFEGRLRIIKNPEKFAKQFNEAYQNLPPDAKVVSGATNGTLSMSTVTAVPLANSTAVGSYTAGAAFSLHQSGVDSFGIAPYVAGKSALSAPSAAQFSEECPLVASGSFSAVGLWLQKHFRLFTHSKTTKKIPS